VRAGRFRYRVRVVAAQALLDRAWGKPKDSKDDDHQQVSVDRSNATSTELQVLLALVQRWALRPASSDSAAHRPNLEIASGAGQAVSKRSAA
jgi:hypothetical protein